ncbi:AAA family ATPase [Serratia ureilytica]|uniref:AAA family ATPase n=1 Tax=Serratia ureilytica TaxID=300181 RepID=UPI0018D61DE4|nr:AAA family ATPase [Serratia ureilytica]MBH3120273.1 AAA family ATPase [Serratia ureilytica]
MSYVNKRIVITGGPGSGKSTLLDSLRAKGCPTAAEAGRAIIRDQVTIGGNALPWKDRVAFAELLLNWELRSWHEAGQSETPFFFDRGLSDVAGYLALCSLPVPVHMERAIELFRYARSVFIAPPWKEIFVQDTERKQSFGEAVHTYHAMAEAYGRYGYNLIRLPLCGSEERAEFILSCL